MHEAEIYRLMYEGKTLQALMALQGPYSGQPKPPRSYKWWLAGVFTSHRFVDWLRLSRCERLAARMSKRGYVSGEALRVARENQAAAEQSERRMREANRGLIASNDTLVMLNRELTKKLDDVWEQLFLAKSKRKLIKKLDDVYEQEAKVVKPAKRGLSKAHYAAAKGKRK